MSENAKDIEVNDAEEVKAPVCQVCKKEPSKDCHCCTQNCLKCNAIIEDYKGGTPLCNLCI